jgi:hypothetical protein
MVESWLRYKLTAEFLSDAHPGSGSGGIGVDALFARDRNNRPVVWASHIEGVLRDAARRLYGDQKAEEFFGRAGGDYARLDRQRAVFTSLYTEGSVESHVWRSTARRAFDNRAPKDDTLRTIEYVPKGTKLSGEIELPQTQCTFLQRLVAEVDRLGSGRSSGTGRVKLTLTQVELKPRAVGQPKENLRLLLKNRDPLCITATATPDNLIPSLSFVPGRTLLGAMAAWLIGEGEEEAASLLTSGRISVSDALPLPEKPNRLETVEILPAPLTLQSKKPKGPAGEVPWWAESKAPTLWLDAWNSEEKLKRPTDNLFVYRPATDFEWMTFRPSVRVRLRNGRPNPNQIEPSLFSLEQIVEETYFLSELHGSKENMEQLVQKLASVLDGRRWLRVGKGGGPVEVVELSWCDKPSVITHEDSALVTLTSDLLVRDELLRWCTSLDEDVLRKLVGNNVQLTIEKSMQDSVMVYGFNGTSRLWRMPVAAIRLGSVFKVSGNGIRQLAKLASDGKWLGERTHEGFGRFRIDNKLPGVASKMVSESKPEPKNDDPEEVIAKETKIWCEEYIRTDKSGGERKPSLSQWFDLVSDLERGEENAIDSRLHPKTAGGRNWEYKGAKKILEKLQKIKFEQASSYARFFVRWLRAEMKRGLS